MAHCQRARCVTPSYQVHQKVSRQIMQPRLTRQVQGFSSASSFSDNFPLEQTTSGVKWKSKERDLISRGNGAWIRQRLIDRAGAAVLFTLKRFPWVKAVTGPRSRSPWSCQDRLLSGWWRDRPQIDDAVARTRVLQRADTQVRPQSDFGRLLPWIRFRFTHLSF